MIAKQYRPNFFDGFEKNESHFSSTDELLEIDWVKNFTNDDNFHRFSLSRDKRGTHNHTLMAEYNDGFEWWVVAFINEEDISGIDDLPEWKSKYKDGK